MKKTLSLTLMTLLLCVCMVFGLTACGGFTQDDIDNAVNSATATLNEQIAELNADIAEKEAKITTLEGEKATLTTEKGELEADITALEAEKADLEADKAELEDEVETLETEKKALSDENAELEASITAKNTEIATLNSSITSLTEEKATLTTKVSELNAEITTLNERITELEESSEADGAKITELKAKVSSLESEKATLTARVTELEGTITNKNAEIADLEADVASLEAMKEKLNKEITDLTYQLNTKNTEITNLNSSISALETEKAELEEQVASLEASIVEKNTEIANLNSSVEKLTEEKGTLIVQMAELEKEYGALKSENADLESKIEELENKINCLEGNHGGTLAYTSNNDGTHYGTYSCCGVVTESVSCSGGEATCLVGKICESCGFEYDTKAPDEHESKEFTYTANADGTTHTKKYRCCEAVVNATEAHTVTEWTYDDTTHEGNCDHCGTTVTEDHSGGEATCIAKALCETCGASHGELAANNHTRDTYTNGFRDCCDAYQSATDSDGDGYYEIGNAGQLYWFAALVNKNSSAEFKGKLTSDITVNVNVLNDDGTLNGDGSNFRPWIPIGYDPTGNNTFFASFDGNGKTVSGLYFNDSNTLACIGLLGFVYDGTIKNVGVVDSYLRGGNFVGGVVGLSANTVENCYSEATVIGSGNVGGVVGRTDDAVTNCYNTGFVSGNNNVGGVVGYNNYATVTNCYNIGSVSGNDRVGGVIGYNNDKGTVTNCYYLDTACSIGIGTDKNTTTPGSAVAKTAEEFASADMATLLNGTQTDAPWEYIEGNVAPTLKVFKEDET